MFVYMYNWFVIILYKNTTCAWISLHEHYRPGNLLKVCRDTLSPCNQLPSESIIERKKWHLQAQSRWILFFSGDLSRRYRIFIRIIKSELVATRPCDVKSSSPCVTKWRKNLLLSDILITHSVRQII